MRGWRDNCDHSTGERLLGLQGAAQREASPADHYRQRAGRRGDERQREANDEETLRERETAVGSDPMRKAGYPQRGGDSDDRRAGAKSADDSGVES